MVETRGHPLDLPEGATAAPAGLLRAFWRFEVALLSGDLIDLAELTAPGPDTLDGGPTGLVIGHEQIGAHRAAQDAGAGGAPLRDILDVHVRPIGDDTALVIATTAPSTGGRGLQTQLWHRDEEGEWQVDAAQLSVPARLDGSVWRVAGAPLVAGAAGPPPDEPANTTLGLRGHTVAVKDLYRVAGFTVGAGVPAYLAGSDLASSSASAVQALLDAGADVAGIARADEFGFSTTGRNPHYGTPPNVVAPGGLPGGSSSGPAAAVALGQASIGLGTDTAGSIRVPASYQGLWGLRSTHGAVSRDGLLPLAPSFDAVGWIARGPETLRAAAAASGLPRSIAPVRVVLAPGLMTGVDEGVESAFEAAIEFFLRFSVIPDADMLDLSEMDAAVEAFRRVQSHEAWAQHGDWIRAHPGTLGPEVEARFAAASAVTDAAADDARATLSSMSARLREALEDHILLLPATASPAPARTAPADELERVRAATIRLTCLASLAGLPALSVPALTVDGAPVGLGLVGPVGSDLGLIDTGERMLREYSAI